MGAGNDGRDKETRSLSALWRAPQDERGMGTGCGETFRTVGSRDARSLSENGGTEGGGVNPRGRDVG